MNHQTLNKKARATFYFRLMSLVKIYGLENILLILKHIEGHSNKKKIMKKLPLNSSPPFKPASYWLLFMPIIWRPKDKMTQSDVSKFGFDNGCEFLLWFLKNKEISIWQRLRKMSEEHNNKSIEMIECQSKLNQTRKYEPYQIQEKFSKLKPNLSLLKRLIRQNQKEYIRRRLRAIYLLWTGFSRREVEEKLDINPSTLISWLKIIVEYGVQYGLKILASPKKLFKLGKLEPKHQYTLLYILNNCSPHDFFYAQNIFTARILVEIVNKLWGIDICDETIYNFLHKQNFSYQRGHNDYEDADPAEQRQYVEELYQVLKNDEAGVKKVFFDECSMTNCGTIFYAWAKRNTRVRVYTSQRKKKRLNCFISVDAMTGKEYVEFYNKSTSTEVSDYFYNLILKSYQEGYSKIIIILDNHKTHKDLMRYRLWLKVKANPALADFKIEYLDTPRYSPDFNLAEYIIHQLRLKLLHHLEANKTILQIQEKIGGFLNVQSLQTPIQIKNTINHILKMGGFTSRI